MESIKDKLLNDLFDGHRIDDKNYELADSDSYLRRSELTKYMFELKRAGYLDFHEKRAFTTGGQRNKYGYNTRIINSEDIWLEPKGNEFVEGYRNKTVSKTKSIKRSTLLFVKDLFIQVRTKLIDKIASVILTAIGVVSSIGLYIIFK